MEIPTVISAVGTAQPLTEAPAAVSVLSAEDIKNAGSLSIPDLFRLVPGLDYARTSASNVTIAARGLNNGTSAGASRMQVLVDGLSVYEDVFGLIFWHEIPIPLDEIERIEVVRSPATALYGNRAFAGLVNIVTKSPDALRGTFVRQTLGEAGTEITDVIHAGGTGPVRYKLSAGYDRTNQFANSSIGRTDDQLGRADARGHAYVEGRIDEASKLALNLGFTQFDRRELGIATALGAQTASGYQGYAQLNYSRGDLQAQVAYNRFEAEVTAPFQVRSYAPVANILQAQIRYDTRLGGSHLVSAGAQYRHQSVESALFVDGGVTEDLGTFFVQDQWSLLRSLTLTTGVGVDVHPAAGVSTSPRVALVYVPWPEHAFRVSAARAFRDPALLENFVSLPVAQVVSTPLGPVTGLAQLAGNDRLKPEEIRSYEVGYQGRLFGRVRVWADFFYSQLDDLIDLQPLSATIRTYTNAFSGDAYGAEAGLEPRLTSWLSGFANYTYLQRKGDAGVMGTPASNHKANMGLAASLPWGFSASATGTYVGVPENPHTGLDAYFVANLRVANAFKVLGLAGELSLEVFNLFNDAHREVTGGDVIDRRISGSLRVRF